MAASQRQRAMHECPQAACPRRTTRRRWPSCVRQRPSGGAVELGERGRGGEGGRRVTPDCRARSDSGSRPRSQPGGFGPRRCGPAARLGPARRVVERVVETGSGRRWRGLSGACTFAGSSSRNLRTRRATHVNEREFDQVERPRQPLPVPIDPPGEAPPQRHQGAHRRRGAGRCLPSRNQRGRTTHRSPRRARRHEARPRPCRSSTSTWPVNRHRSAADAATVRDHPRPREKRAGPVPAPPFGGSIPRPSAPSLSAQRTPNSP